MYLEIITPEKKVLREEIDQITVPTTTGQITIMPHHENLITSLVAGEMIVKIKGKEQFLGITGGFLEVSNNSVTILADYAVRAEDIEVEKTMAAQKRAEDVLKRSKEDISERDFAVAQADMRKAIMELHVAGRRRRRTSH